MCRSLIKGLLAEIAIKLLDNCRHLSRRLLRIEAVKGYLHAVRLARLSTLGLLGLGLVVGLIGVGVLLLHAGLFVLLPWSVPAKAIFAMLLGLVYAVVGVVVLCLAMSEKTWLDKSGAAELLSKATGPSE